LSKLPTIVPPADVLGQTSGIEEALRPGKRLGTIGWIAFFVSLIQVSILVFTSGWWDAISTSNWSEVQNKWPFIVSTLVLIVSVVLTTWTRFWIKESRRPFRYTYSIDEFEPSDGAKGQVALSSLDEELAAHLAQTIGRFSLLDERYSKKVEFGDSHIHIGGSYRVRHEASGSLKLEILPWVRFGPLGAPATLAPRVVFPLSEEHLRSDAPLVDERLVGSVYFNIVTHLYRQIRQDIRRKIELLPTKYLKAAAYFYEAEDYLRSNTPDAYDDAQALYREVLRLYDPAHWSETRVSPFRQLLAWWSLTWRRSAAPVWPWLARIVVTVARAETGYATTILYRRVLAGPSGRRLYPVFEAAPVAIGAVKRLRRLSARVPDRNNALFDALLTATLAEAELGSPRAEHWLQGARMIDPLRAERDARYSYAMGRVSTRQREQFLQRAIELTPEISQNALDQPLRLVAQLQLAIESDLAWRRRPALDSDLLEGVIEQYERVLATNPGNIAAWANTGYLLWLIEDNERAEGVFLRGSEYRERKSGAVSAELAYGLARVAAEGGRLVTAHRHFTAALSAHFTQHMSYGPDRYTHFYFDRMGEGVLQRFERYHNRVKRLRCETEVGQPVSRDVQDFVHALALNDYGEASFNYFLRSGDRRHLDDADALFLAGLKVEPRSPLLSYNMHRLQRLRAKLSGENVSSDYIKSVSMEEPQWVDAMAERALVSAISVTRERHEAVTDVRNARVEAARSYAETLEIVRALLPFTWLWTGDEPGDLVADLPTLSAKVAWERELNDVHIKALFALAIALASSAATSNARLGRLVLEHIQGRFWPGDFEVLRACAGISSNARSKAPSEPDERTHHYVALLRSGVTRAIDEDPSFANLVQVDDRVFPSREAVEIFARVAEEATLPDSLYVWLGDQLVKLGDTQTASEAYRRGRSHDHVRVNPGRAGG
jgi:hypothetical protein